MLRGGPAASTDHRRAFFMPCLRHLDELLQMVAVTRPCFGIPVVGLPTVRVHNDSLVRNTPYILHDFPDVLWRRAVGSNRQDLLRFT